MYILTRFYPLLFIYFFKVITKADHAVDAEQKPLLPLV